MNFYGQTKSTLAKLAEHLDLDVDSVGKKPNKEEYVSALEALENEDADLIKLAMEELKIEDVPEDDEDNEQDVPEEGTVFTYVGGGEESPARILFMGVKEFVKGRATVVDDPKLIKKLTGNPTFIKGKVEPEVIQEIEDNGSDQANANRKADKALDAQFTKKHKTE